MQNLALAGFFLLFLVPLVLHLGDVSTSAQIVLIVLAVPLTVLTLGLLASAARPGCVGRAARRLRHRRD